MNYELEKVALRHGALYLPDRGSRNSLTPPSAVLVAMLSQHGFSPDEEVLHALDALSEDDIRGIAGVIEDIYGDRLNWGTLINKWQTPTGETWTDHVLADIANIVFGENIEGTTLPCGHTIPARLFDLSRYNGCPLCGTPFRIADGIFKGQGDPFRQLHRFTDEDMQLLFEKTAASPLPPDATSLDSLRILSQAYRLPDGFRIGNIESAVAIAAGLFTAGAFNDAFTLLDGPDALMRMLWFMHTGHTRIIRPAQIRDKERIKLHYTRRQCAAVAAWLDSTISDTDSACATIHPYRGMWVRFIRALRLSEYARRKSLANLSEFLDRFYNSTYPVWAGELEAAWLEGDAGKVFPMLRTRPGVFARMLFAAMLRFPDRAINSFAEVATGIAPRLLVSLDSYALDYFMPLSDERIVTLASGKTVCVPLNSNMSRYTAEGRADFARDVKRVATDALTEHYRRKYGQSDKRIYIAPELFDIPVPVGDRGNAVHDTESAMAGQRFKVKGDKVRLFLQWGKGLPAQHLDMDLSARICYGDGKAAECAYYNLSLPGAIHSGDIQYIPDNVGTAEYIEFDIPTLIKNGAHYAIFTCNAYSNPTLSPNMQLGWMDSDSPMKVDNDSGVAYDPSTVSHMVHISEGELSRGLVFGVLDIPARVITWLEMPNGTQRLNQLDSTAIELFLRKLRNKITIGELLRQYAAARGFVLADDPAGADEIFDPAWALNASDVANLLL